MQAKSNVKPRDIEINHKQPAVKTGLPVKTQVKAGALSLNHNQMVVRA